MARLVLPLAALFTVVATAAQAHPGVGGMHGFGCGFAHPLGGIDHVLAMAAIGLVAAQLGGRALWLVPLAFLSMMGIGGALGVAGIALPFVEIGIGLSVVVLGVAMAAQLRLSMVAAIALAGFFAVFHGHAHGAEMPETVSGLSYGLGFILATAALHAAGIGLGVGLPRLTGARAVQAVGGAIAFGGVAILAGTL